MRNDFVRHVLPEMTRPPTRLRSTAIFLLYLLTSFAGLVTVTTALAQSRGSVTQQLNYVERLFRAGNYGQVIEIGNQIDGPLRQTVGENSRDYGAFLTLLAGAHAQIGNAGNAEEILRRALTVFHRATGPQSLEVASTLANLAESLKRSGHPNEAIGYLQQALAIQEARAGANASAVANTLNSIAGCYIDSGRRADAEAILKRAIAIWQRTPRANPVDMTRPMSNLALVYGLSNRENEAERLYLQVIALKRQALGPAHPDLIAPLNNLADIYSRTGRASEAVDLLRFSLSITERILGVDQPVAIPTLINLSSAYASAGDLKNADDLLQRVLRIQAATLGPNHPSVALTLHNLASVRGRSGQTSEAIAYSRDSVRIASAGMKDGIAATAFNTRSFFEGNLFLLDEGRKQKIIGPEATDEAFQTAQWINASTAAAALNQVAVRFSSGSNALAGAVRAQQDALAEYRKADAVLVASISIPGPRNLTQDARLRSRVSELSRDVEQRSERLALDFPDYAALANPRPASAAELAPLLRPSEALIYFVVAEQELHAFVLTNDGLTWVAIPVGSEALLAKVSDFRRGLDADAARKSLTVGKPDLFDLLRSHEMYDLLLKPFEETIREKKNLMIVPTGPLTALPFHLLVTGPPETGNAARDSLEPFRRAQWLAKRQAVTILPSVGSLKIGRALSFRAHAEKPIIGFGDPIFGGTDDPRAGSDQRGLRDVTVDFHPSFADFWKGAGVDRAKLSQALPRLADTADELNAVATTLKAQAGDIRLGAAATETAVKQAPLANYRIVYFATHSLVAGDVNGIGEPSLALSLPAQPTSVDDGLLTSSEVAELSLNADWVVLSACNTISGNRPGAEALSGLARAFFYAGARSLLVSHWAVISSAATTLTISSFKNLAANPEIGGAEALRLAMVAYLNDPTDPWNAYPAMWGPFVVVGDNTAR